MQQQSVRLRLGLVSADDCPQNGQVTLQYYINTCASSQSDACAFALRRPETLTRLADKILPTILQDGVATWIGDCQR